MSLLSSKLVAVGQIDTRGEVADAAVAVNRADDRFGATDLALSKAIGEPIAKVVQQLLAPVGQRMKQARKGFRSVLADLLSPTVQHPGRLRATRGRMDAAESLRSLPSSRQARVPGQEAVALLALRHCQRGRRSDEQRALTKQ